MRYGRAALIMELSTGTIFSLAYGGAQLIVLICLAIKIHFEFKKKDKECTVKEFGLNLWADRSVYGNVLVHIYDTGIHFHVIHLVQRSIPIIRTTGSIPLLGGHLSVYIAKTNRTCFYVIRFCHSVYVQRYGHPISVHILCIDG